MSDKFNLESKKMPNLDFRIPEIPQVNHSDILRQIHEQSFVNLGYAHVMCERLRSQIRQFEASLQPNEEIAVNLASFGTRVLVLIDNVGYQNPYFITFSGVNADTKQKVLLVQHVSQTSVLFTAVTVPKEDNRKARRIGFNVDTDNEEEKP